MTIGSIAYIWNKWIKQQQQKEHNFIWIFERIQFLRIENLHISFIVVVNSFLFHVSVRKKNKIKLFIYSHDDQGTRRLNVWTKRDH